MALGAVLAAALTTPATRAYALWIDGLDVIREPAAASRYGVPFESVEVSDVGPGGVSSMTFDVEDPQRILSITEGQFVRFHRFVDSVADWTMFSGWVDKPTMRTDYGTGRRWTVSVVGANAALDWYVVPFGTPSLPADMFAEAAVLSVAGAAAGPPGVSLRVFAGGPNIARPIFLDPNLKLLTSIDVSGLTLRRAIQAIAANLYSSSAPGSDLTILATVDPYLGLAVWQARIAGTEQANWWTGGGSIIDTVAFGNPKPDRLELTRDATAKIRAVYVVGGNAAGSGWVRDGSGLPGRTAILTDTTSTTVERRDQIGANYLAASSVAVRGSLEVEWGPPGAPFVGYSLNNWTYAGGTFQLTDASTGQAAAGYRVMTFRHAFGPGGLTVRSSYTFGALAPSAQRLTRRLTRNVVS